MTWPRWPSWPAFRNDRLESATAPRYGNGAVSKSTRLVTAPVSGRMRDGIAFGRRTQRRKRRSPALERSEPHRRLHVCCGYFRRFDRRADAVGGLEGFEAAPLARDEARRTLVAETLVRGRDLLAVCPRMARCAERVGFADARIARYRHRVGGFRQRAQSRSAKLIVDDPAPAGCAEHEQTGRDQKQIARQHFPKHASTAREATRLRARAGNLDVTGDEVRPRQRIFKPADFRVGREMPRAHDGSCPRRTAKCLRRWSTDRISHCSPTPPTSQCRRGLCPQFGALPAGFCLRNRTKREDPRNSAAQRSGRVAFRLFPARRRRSVRGTNFFPRRALSGLRIVIVW